MANSVWKESSDALNELFAALSKAMAQVRNAPNNRANHFAKKGRDGQPIANYADLATVLDTLRPVLAANGLSVTQAFHPQDADTLLLVTTLGHTSGQFQRSYLPLKANLAPQQLVATSTYLKRVALCSLCGIASEDDDDGEVAQQAVQAAAGTDALALEARAHKALAAAPDDAARDAILVKTQSYVANGSLPPAALLRLVEYRKQLEGGEPKCEPKTNGKKAMAGAAS